LVRVKTRETQLLLLLDEVDRLGGGFAGRGDGIDRDVERVAQKGARQLADLVGHRRREEQRLAVARDRPDDAPHVADEAHVQHAVRLVEDEVGDAGEIHHTFAHEVEQAARSGDENVEAGAQRPLLGALAYAAEDHVMAQAGPATVGAEARADLRGELARRRQHEGAQRAAALRQVLKDGERERRRLARPGLGAAEQVTALEQVGNGLGLDRRRCVVARGGDRRAESVGESKCGERAVAGGALVPPPRSFLNHECLEEPQCGSGQVCGIYRRRFSRRSHPTLET
jgi:hypothetical protein